MESTSASLRLPAEGGPAASHDQRTLKLTHYPAAGSLDNDMRRYHARAGCVGTGVSRLLSKQAAAGPEAAAQ